MTTILMFGFVFLLELTNVFCFSSYLPAPVDLSHALDEETPYWDAKVKFQLINRINLTREDGSFYATNDFMGAEHGGTHLDAPSHFNRKGLNVDEIPLDRLLSNGEFDDFLYYLGG